MGNTAEVFALGPRTELAASSISNAEVAKMTGLSAGYIGQVVAGRKLPALDKVELIAAKLGILVSDIFARGERELDEQTARQAREHLQRLRAERTAQVVIEVLPYLDADALGAVVQAAQDLYDELVRHDNLAAEQAGLLDQ